LAGLVTITAIYWFVIGWSERYGGFLSTGGADCGEHFALLAVISAIIATGLFFSGRATGRATTGFVGEPLFSEEFLFRGRKGEFLTTVSASKGFVVKHLKTSKILFARWCGDFNFP